MKPVNIDTLKQNFFGTIIMPNDDAYEQARKSYVGSGSPAIVVRPNTAGDVVVAIQFAQSNSLVISIRSGGHSVAGFCTNNGGIIIDLSVINSVELIDKQNNIVRIGTGATWKKVAGTLQEFGLALSSGDSTSVGVGGLALGGGIGWMVRKYGLTIDSLKAAETVTADGKILRTTATEYPDLFWAIRGGGGNFGVVTHFEFAAKPVGKVFSGMIIYAMENLSALLKGWRDAMRASSEDLTVMFLVMPSFFGNPPSAIAWCCYAGDDETAAMKAIGPLLKIGTVVQNMVVKKNYADVLEEPHPPEGVKAIVTNGFVEQLSDELIDAIASTHGKEVGPVLQLRYVKGAMNRIDSGSTAFAHRGSETMLVSASFVPLEATKTEIDQAMIPWKTISPFTKGAYVNFFSSANKEDVAAAYPQETYNRLAAVKKIYDPKNIFNQNYNIPPAD
ncbi:MAG: FAD-binding oxidoreductase [Bacteroidota bacterium]|nr:FAD-binding oxidoreductase [Bacteroidota bacterium]